MKHTPGPWEAYCMGSEGYIVKRDNRGLSAATVKAELRDRTTPIAYMDRDFETQKANARLIAAAPRMFEVLRAIVEAFAAREDDRAASVALNIGRDVLLEATGE